MLNKTIVLFHGELDTLNVFTDQMCEGFKSIGYEVFIFDLGQLMSDLSRLYKYITENSDDNNPNSKPVIAMIGFNLAFFGLSTETGINVWEQLGIPCINILVDHPFWYRDIILKMPSNSMAICIDRKHSDFINRFYPNISGSGFMAHGGTPTDNKLKKLSDRKIDVLYAGSLYADFANVQKPDFSKWDFSAEEVCNSVIRLLMDNRNKTIENAIDEALSEKGVVLSEETLAEFISECVFIERVVSSHFREKIVKSLVQAGINIEIYGTGWERCSWIESTNVRYNGKISPEEVLIKMEESKIVLNTLPWFKDGTHERIYNGMLRRCVVVSEESQYLVESIPDNVWFHFDIADESIEMLPELVKGILEDIATDDIQRIADEAYEFAVSENTWQDRAMEIHEAVLTYL